MTRTTMQFERIRNRAVVVALALMFAAMPVLSNEKSGATQVTDVEVQLTTVWVTLANPGSEASSGTVEVTASVLGLAVRSAVRFEVQARGTARVPVRFLAPVGEVIVVGISDDVNPQ